MAYTMKFYFMVLSLSLVSFIFLSPSFAKDDDFKNLKSLCSKTKDSQWCLNILKSDSRSKDANNRRLTEVALEIAYSRAQVIHQDLNKLSDTTKDSKLEDQYRSCSKNYNDIIRDLEEAKSLFRKDKYKRIRVQLRDASQEVDACKSQLEKKWSGSDDFTNKNKELEFLVDILRVSSEEVIGHNWHQDRSLATSIVGNKIKSFSNQLVLSSIVISIFHRRVLPL